MAIKMRVGTKKLVSVGFAETQLSFFFMPPRRRVGGHINLPLSIRLSVRIQIHGLFCYLLLQFWSYSFNILQDVYTHNGGGHVHRILIFFKYSRTQSFFSYQLHKGNMVCLANSSYSFRATALIFCRMFIHIMEVCIPTGFSWSGGGIICVLQTHFIFKKSL